MNASKTFQTTSILNIYKISSEFTIHSTRIRMTFPNLLCLLFMAIGYDTKQS